MQAIIADAAILIGALQHRFGFLAAVSAIDPHPGLVVIGVDEIDGDLAVVHVLERGIRAANELAISIDVVPRALRVSPALQGPVLLDTEVLLVAEDRHLHSNTEPAVSHLSLAWPDSLHQAQFIDPFARKLHGGGIEIDILRDPGRRSTRPRARRSLILLTLCNRSPTLKNLRWPMFLLACDPCDPCGRDHGQA